MSPCSPVLRPVRCSSLTCSCLFRSYLARLPCSVVPLVWSSLSDNQRSPIISVLFPREGKEWVYISSTRCGNRCKFGQTSIALNQRWKRRAISQSWPLRARGAETYDLG
eukprot:1774020-Amphidinium_carterae.1